MGTLIQTESWNQVTNSSGFSTDGSTEASPAAAPPTLSPQDPTVAPASSSPLNYYVRFTLSDGDVVTVNGAQFFALDGFSFSEQQSSGTGSQSGGAGTGKVTLNPLQLTLSPLSSQPALFQALASGATFQEVDVLGYSQASNQLVTDDSFGLVSANNLSVDASGATQVSLEYGSAQITNPNGNSPPGVPGTLSPQDPTVAPASSSPLNYYVRFTLSDGDVVTVNGAQFFALDGFSFSEQQSSGTGSQSGGAGTGKVTLNPLQLTLSPLSSQPALFQALASGATFQEVDVLGYSQASNQLVTDDSFGLVSANNLSVDASGA